VPDDLGQPGDAERDAHAEADGEQRTVGEGGAADEADGRAPGGPGQRRYDVPAQEVPVGVAQCAHRQGDRGAPARDVAGHDQRHAAALGEQRAGPVHRPAAPGGG
jgi:hypothetical protein